MWCVVGWEKIPRSLICKYNIYHTAENENDDGADRKKTTRRKNIKRRDGRADEMCNNRLITV